MQEQIKEFIKWGTCAPSGDNSQPWRFEINENILRVYNKPNADNPILNYEQTGSYIAHGALVENISVAAKYYGYESNIEIFKEKDNVDLIATISFKKTDQTDSPLFPYISERHTNRKSYRDIPINADILNELNTVGKEMDGINIRYINDKKIRSEVAKGASLMESIALETEPLHRLFFNDILWNEEDNNAGKTGLYIKTLELPPPMQYLFRLLPNWTFTKMLNKIIRFSRLAAAANAKIYASGGSIGIIVLEKYDAKKFINVGRILQRTWLIATKNRLSIQPISGLLFLAHRIMHDNKEIPISRDNLEKVKRTYELISKRCNAENNSIAFIFRIGYADKVSARSKRRIPEIINSQ